MKTSNATLMSECRECGGGGLRGDGHPNDPWAKTWECRECEGTGEVIAECQCCSRDATEVFDGYMLCMICATEQKEDALVEAEYRRKDALS